MSARALLIAAAVAWVATLSGLIWMLAAAEIAPDIIGPILIDLPFVEKAGAILSGLAAGFGIVGVLRGQRSRGWIGSAAALGCGVLGALHVEAGLRYGLLYNGIGPVPFPAYAHFHSQALVVLLIALTGTAVCLGLLNVRPAPGTA